MYEAPNFCAQCGGKCCKQMPGSMMPDDILTMFPTQSLVESLRLAFQSGDYVIDWWENDPRDEMDYDDPDYLHKAEYVRPRTDKDRARLYNASWGGQCVMLSDTGCKLAPDMRPLQCRMLEPKDAKGNDCTMHSPGSKQAIAIAWIPHQAALFAAARPFA